MMTLNRNCPVCGNNSAKVLFHPKSSPGTIAACNVCQMVYVANIDDPHALIFDGPVIYDQIDKNILTSSSLDDVKDSWEFDNIARKESEGPALRRNAQMALEKIEAFTGNNPPKGRLLDYGSGIGFFLSIAKERGWDACGLEPLPASAVYSRAKFGVKIVTDTIHKDTFPLECFDAITSFQVFEHLPNPLESLRYLTASLRMGGILMIEVPCFDTWTMKLMRSNHRHFVQDHLNFFSQNTLSSCFRINGFEIVDCYRPSRIMSVEHLYDFWVAGKLPKRLSRIGYGILQFDGVREKTIQINLGDIVAMIGRKVR